MGISTRSKHQYNDMYIHKKHGFIVKIIDSGVWSNLRLVEVVKGEVPPAVRQRVRSFTGGMIYEGITIPAQMIYDICSLTNCFNKLDPKSTRVLFG